MYYVIIIMIRLLMYLSSKEPIHYAGSMICISCWSYFLKKLCNQIISRFIRFLIHNPLRKDPLHLIMDLCHIVDGLLWSCMFLKILLYVLNVHKSDGNVVFVTADIPKCKKSDPMLPMCFMLATDILRPYLIKGEFTTYGWLLIPSLSLHLAKFRITLSTDIRTRRYMYHKRRHGDQAVYKQKNNILY